MTTHPQVIAMGVSASGKSVFGRALADALDVPFCEGDDLHPAANVAKMHAGHPLDDDDRAPWLDRVGGWLDTHAGGGVASCSALKRAYRDRLRARCPGIRFVLLDADEAQLQRRIAARPNHFMPPSLLGSQLATLERPGTDEAALVLDATAAMDANVARAAAWLRSDPAR